MLESESSFISRFSDTFGSIEDTRQQSKISYPLLEILFLTIISIAGGARGWQDISVFASSKLATLRLYFPFASGIPSDDTLRRFFRFIDHSKLNEGLFKLFELNKSTASKEIFSCDGKALRGTKDGSDRALNMFNIYAGESNLVVYAESILSKTNEITAMPEALDLIDVSKAVVTADAIMCTKVIASHIIAKDADYVLALKANNGYLHKSVEDHFKLFFDVKASDSYTVTEKNKGRLETRLCRVIYDISSIKEHKDWQNLKSIVEITSTVENKGKTTSETRYYISSLSDSAKEFFHYIRRHWKVEAMHYVMDVSFREDASRIRQDNAPICMAILRRMVFNILEKMKSKRESKPLLIKKIGWSDDYLEKFIKHMV